MINVNINNDFKNVDSGFYCFDYVNELIKNIPYMIQKYYAKDRLKYPILIKDDNIGFDYSLLKPIEDK